MSTRRLLTYRALVAALGCLGLAWAAFNLARAAAVDEFQNLEARLLRFETFRPTTATSLLESTTTRHLSACDTHAERALMLLEMPLADADLRSGAAANFDRHLGSVEGRARQIVACVPRDPLSWIVLFGLKVEHGQLDDHAFDLLATSYEIAPNEAWVAVRRIAVAIPVILAAPQPIQRQILLEFQNLVRNGFVEVPARSYRAATAAARVLLQSRIDGLDAASQGKFADALEKLRS